MRIIVSLLTLLVGCFLPQLGFAQERPKATVTIVYINNSNCSFDSVLDEHVMNVLHGKVDGIYNIIPGDYYKKNLFDSNQNPSPNRIIDTVQNDNIDYLIYFQLQPFNRKERMALFRYGKDMTATAILRIYSGKNGKCLFEKNFSAKASDDQTQVFLEDSLTAWIAIRSKNLGVAASDKVLYQAGEYISVNLPLAPLPSQTLDNI